MRISITNPGKPAESLYIIKDLYLRDVRGKKSASNKSGKDRTTVTVEKLGKVSDLMEKMNLSHDEVIAWARQRAKSLTDEEKAANAKITIDYFPNQRIEKDVPSSCNCGYLFLQSLYTQLRPDNTCRNIRNRYSFDFDLNSILSDLDSLHVFFLLQANCLPIPSANHCLNRQNMIFIRFTVLS